MSTPSDQVRDLAFCYFGLLRCRTRFERIAALLPAARRQKILECAGAAASLSMRELAEGLTHLRQTEAAAELQQAGCFKGLQVENVPPALRRWFCAGQQDLHGREDH